MAPKFLSVALVAFAGIKSLSGAMMISVSLAATLAATALLSLVLRPFRTESTLVRSLCLAVATFSFSLCAAMVCEAYLGLKDGTVWRFAFLNTALTFIILWSPTEKLARTIEEKNNL